MTLAQAYKKQFGKVSYPFEVYDSNGNRTYYEESDGFWSKREYDANGNETYLENSDGYWCKREYDTRNNKTYYEESDGFWRRWEYDDKGKETYYEDSDGNKRGTPRSQSCDGKVIEVDGKKYKLTEL